MSVSDIVRVSISRESAAVTVAAFNTDGILAEFATDKTTTTFDRYRTYTSVTAMSDDGWAAGDDVYDAAVKMFSQPVAPNKILVGRKDANDADWDAALNAIASATADWYAFSAVMYSRSTVVFDADFVTANSIASTVAGTVVTPVVFDTDQSTTMTAIKDQIETDVTGAKVTIDPDDVDERTLIIEVFGAASEAEVVVTLGATQPAVAITESIDAPITEISVWTATQKKVFFYSTSDTATYDSGSTTDIMYALKAAAYDRVAGMYYKDDDYSWIEQGWIGKFLPKTIGSTHWAYKTLTAITGYFITPAQRDVILGKNGNTYTERGGNYVTEKGTVANGERIDVIMGVDWIESRIEEAVWGLLYSEDKVPMDDGGIQQVVNAINGVLSEAVRNGIIQDGFTVTAPPLEDIPTADIIAGNLPDVELTAVLLGAILTTDIVGTVTPN